MKLLAALLLLGVTPDAVTTFPPTEVYACPQLSTFSIGSTEDYVSAGHGLYRKALVWHAEATFSVCDFGKQPSVAIGACEEKQYVPSETASTRKEAIRLIVRDVERVLQ